MNHIICVKWGNKYISEYANVLYSMCKRHTTLPFEFHCLTDDPSRLNPEIKVTKLPTDPWVKSWWSKLWMFSPDMPIKGNILYFDLDLVIFKNIDCLLTYSPDTKFFIIRDFNRCRVKDWQSSNSSVMRFKTGTMDYLWNDFTNNPAQVMQNNHGDQDWIMNKGHKDITHWPDEWIRSYKWEMIGLKDTKMRKGKKFVFNKPATINVENRVAVFHGEPKPFNCGDQFIIDNWK